MSEHQEHADHLEDEASKLEQQSSKLGEDIFETREDWERRQRDSEVPGATGTPASEAELPPPEPDETD